MASLLIQIIGWSFIAALGLTLIVHAYDVLAHTFGWERKTNEPH